MIVVFTPLHVMVGLGNWGSTMVQLRPELGLLVTLLIKSEIGVYRWLDDADR